MSWLSRLLGRSETPGAVERTNAGFRRVFPFLATIHLRGGKQYLQAFAAPGEAAARHTVQGWLKDGLVAEAPAGTFRHIEAADIEKIDLKAGDADHE